MSVENNGKPDLPKTENESWGFFGTMHNKYPELTSGAWDVALLAIHDATSLPLHTCQTFLDSRHGRHFADQVINTMYTGKTLENAITATVDSWMNYKISRSTARQYGIPNGLPYLTGFAGQSTVDE
jgi:hypothetical protein